MAQAVSLYGCEFVVIKRGVHGQYLYDADAKRRWEIPAYPTRLADVTGAGDAFGGGFVSGFCRDYDPLEGVLRGNVSASLMLEGQGAFHPLEVMPGLGEARLSALRDLVRKV
jgi:sugar/nucleoside kinase (ribokinase family)